MTPWTSGGLSLFRSDRFAITSLRSRNLVKLISSSAKLCIGGFYAASLVHVVVYTLGIPVLRTLAFVGGFAAQAILALAIAKLV